MSIKTSLNKIFDKMKLSKELTPKESMEMLKNLIKNDKVPIQKHLKPGSIVTFVYDAKDKSQNFDRTPLVMVLSTTPKYMLGCNFHWLKVSYRTTLVQYILDKNKNRIRKKLPVQISYKSIRAAMKGIGAFPVVRLYIRGRMSATGVRIPDELLMQASKMKTETFTKGKANSTTLWTRAKQKALSAKRKLLR
jgi:hypothetical protein